MLHFTEKAADKVKELIAEEGLESTDVRINIFGSGCSGLSFDFFFEEDPSKEDDVIIESLGINIIVNQVVVLYLEDTEIDYVESLYGGGFKFNNDTFSSKCACGSSFSL